jgi:hypothetical protein
MTEKHDAAFEEGQRDASNAARVSMEIEALRKEEQVSNHYVAGMLKALRESRPTILREGFERGAQWCVLDMAHKNGSLAVIGSKDGDDSLNRTLRDLFVPKPENKS